MERLRLIVRFLKWLLKNGQSPPLIEVVRDEITELPTDVITVVATGPLTSDALAEKIHALNDGDGFYFDDAGASL